MGFLDDDNFTPNLTPQDVEALKITHWGVDKNTPPNLKVIAQVTLQGGRTAAGIEVGFFLNHDLLGTAVCDDWGQAVLQVPCPSSLLGEAELVARVKGFALEDRTVVEYKTVVPQHPMPLVQQETPKTTISIQPEMFKLPRRETFFQILIQDLLFKTRFNFFLFSKYPITYQEYDFYCEQTGRTKLADNGLERDKTSIVVGRVEAIEYCKWLNENVGKMNMGYKKIKYRLPTKPEYEYACMKIDNDMPLNNLLLNRPDISALHFSSNEDSNTYKGFYICADALKKSRKKPDMHRLF